MVDHAGQELVLGAIGDLVYADEHQSVQAVAVKRVGDDPREDRADRAPRDPQQPLDLRLAHLLRQPRGESFEVERVPRPRPGPRHRLVHVAAAGAIQTSEPALDHAPHAADIQRPPALEAMLFDLQPARATARADRLLRAQHDGHDHRLLPERHIRDPGARKPKHRFNAAVTRTSPSFVGR